MVSKLRQVVSRAFSTSNVLGDGMLVRLRSTTIGMLGLVAAVGLGLVALIAHQGWPGVLSGPLPREPRLVQNDPIVLNEGAGLAPVLASPGGRSGPAATRVGSSTKSASPGARGDEAVTAPLAVGGQPQATSPGGRNHPSRPQAPSPQPTTDATQPPATPPSGKDSPTTPGKGTAKSSPGRSQDTRGHSGKGHERSDAGRGRSHEQSDDVDESSDVSGDSGDLPPRSAPSRKESKGDKDDESDSGEYGRSKGAGYGGRRSSRGRRH